MAQKVPDLKSSMEESLTMVIARIIAVFFFFFLVIFFGFIVKPKKVTVRLGVLAPPVLQQELIISGLVHGKAPNLVCIKYELNRSVEGNLKI